MYLNLLAHLAELEQRLGSESKNFKAVSQAFKDHPNLKAFRDPHGAIQLCASDVNQFATDFEAHHLGTELYVLPYIDDNKVRVFCDPPLWHVADRNPEGFGQVPLASWDDLLTEGQVAIEVIRKIRWHLAAHKPVNYRNISDPTPEGI